MRILIICNDFPPLNSIGAQRSYSWFHYFHENGADVTVITKKWNINSGTLKDVLDVPPIDKGIEIEQLKEGKIIRVNNKLTPPEKLIVKFGELKYTFIRSTLTFLYRMLALVNGFFDKHYLLYKAARDYLKNNKVDVVITTGEPFILFTYASQLKKEFDFKWVADYRDGWYINPNTRHRKNIFNNLLRQWEWLFEKKAIKDADLITTVNPQLSKELSMLHNHPVEVVYNGFDDFYSYDKVAIKLNEKLIFTYCGTLSPRQRVEFLLQAIKELDESGLISENEIEINFIGLNFFPIQLERVINFSPGIKKYIKTTVRIPKDAAIAQCAKSDYLFVFTSEMDQATHAKTFDYVSVQRPIIILPDDHAVINDIVQSLNAGFGFNDKEKLKLFILESIKRKKNDPTIGFSNVDKEKAMFYTRKTQAKIFMELIRNSFQDIKKSK